MNVIGADYLNSSLVQSTGYSAKMVFNCRGAIIFPASQQHRDQKAPGISYEDDYAGNALAGMISPGKIEIRYHRDFTDSQVAAILRELFSQLEISELAGATVTYQGRSLATGM